MLVCFLIIFVMHLTREDGEVKATVSTHLQGKTFNDTTNLLYDKHGGIVMGLGVDIP